MTTRLVAKRSVVIGNRKTSISLEEAFWTSVKDMAANRDVTLAKLVEEIDGKRNGGNLSSSIRLFVLEHYKSHAGN